ncbi:MAG: NAD(P)/FAD-dependent oxidoreductase, partial [Desulfurococcales archaeon]|nr:NAD(P)/FAD-dependent oxidoreductase [Desulfurococcales archaeon]
MPVKAAVVGGGFAGLATALELAKWGVKVDLYEEHREVGYPPHCTGIVSGKVVSWLGKAGRTSLREQFKEIKIAYKSRELAIIEPLDGVYRLDRVLLEKLLLDEGVSEGVEAMLGVKVTSVNPEGKLVAGGKARKYYDLVVIADGWRRSISSRLGLGGYKARLTGVNLVAESREDKVKPGEIRVEFWTSRSEGFFEWEVGLGPKLVLAGTASRNPSHAAAMVRDAHGKYSRVLSVYGGQVVLGPPQGPLRKGKVIVVGDAGGLTKPLTGGGLYPVTKMLVKGRRFFEKGSSPLDALHNSLESIAKELRRHGESAKLVLDREELLGRVVKVIDEPLKVKMPFDSHTPSTLIYSTVKTLPTAITIALK